MLSSRQIERGGASDGQSSHQYTSWTIYSTFIAGSLHTHLLNTSLDKLLIIIAHGESYIAQWDKYEGQGITLESLFELVSIIPLLV